MTVLPVVYAALVFVCMPDGSCGPPIETGVTSVSQPACVLMGMDWVAEHRVREEISDDQHLRVVCNEQELS